MKNNTGTFNFKEIIDRWPFFIKQYASFGGAGVPRIVCSWITAFIQQKRYPAVAFGVKKNILPRKKNSTLSSPKKIPRSIITR